MRSPGRGRASGVSPVPPPPTRCSLSCGFPPFSAAQSPESNYFSLRSFVHPPGPRGRSGGRAAAHFPPPEAEAGPLGRGERSLGGACGAADGTICPSARARPSWAPARGSRLCGRNASVLKDEWQGISPGLPRARALRGPSPEVALSLVAFFFPGRCSFGPQDSAL